METEATPIDPVPDPTGHRRSNSQPIPLFSSPELFGDKNEIIICHKGEAYKIRITRNDKLIMNK